MTGWGFSSQPPLPCVPSGGQSPSLPFGSRFPSALVIQSSNILMVLAPFGYPKIA